MNSQGVKKALKGIKSKWFSTVCTMIKKHNSAGQTIEIGNLIHLTSVNEHLIFETATFPGWSCLNSGSQECIGEINQGTKVLDWQATVFATLWMHIYK